MMDYTHEFIEENIRKKAWEYCIAYVHDFDNLSYEETQWYIENTIKLLMQNEMFAKRIFSTMLN